MKSDKNFQIQLKSGQLTELSSDIESLCHRKKIPLWLVLLDNVPTIILFFLGTILIYHISRIGALIFIGYSLFSIVFFWARICTYCHHYNTLACPCGYGAISSKLFKKRKDKSFKKVFKQNIGVVFPNWFVPFIIAIYLLITQYTNEIFVLTIIFSLIGFVVIPLISRYVGCKNCEIKEDCPWMKIKNQNRND